MATVYTGLQDGQSKYMKLVVTRLFSLDRIYRIKTSIGPFLILKILLILSKMVNRVTPMKRET
jgi:hypothetical protein